MRHCGPRAIAMQRGAAPPGARMLAPRTKAPGGPRLPLIRRMIRRLCGAWRAWALALPFEAGPSAARRAETAPHDKPRAMDAPWYTQRTCGPRTRVLAIYSRVLVVLISKVGTDGQRCRCGRRENARQRDGVAIVRRESNRARENVVRAAIWCHYRHAPAVNSTYYARYAPAERGQTKCGWRGPHSTRPSCR